MRTRLRALVAGAGTAVALVLFAIAAPIASAAGDVIHAGRGGVFPLTSLGPATTAAIVAGVAISVVAVAGVAYFALRFDRGRGATLSAVPDAGVRRDAGGAAAEGHERKAA